MKLLIIGAGPAGVTVAETLRQHNDQSSIIMLSSEPYPPYSPPAMLEYFQTGQKVHFWKGEDFPERLDLDYRSGTRVTAVLPEQKAVQLADGETLSYDKLVIATGGRLYTPIEGADKAGVYNFKSLTGAEELLGRVRKKQAQTALVVGAGFIGVEIALLLRSMGLDVTQMVRSRVMRNMLDPETSELVLEMLKERGIQVLCDDDADTVAFVGEPRAEAVKVRSGNVLSSDLLIAATGIKPNIGFLEASGVETNWGVLVDEKLRTNLSDVYAAGDVAETFDRFTDERYVHAIFPNAVEQAKIVAYNLMKKNVTYEGAENMNSLKHLGMPLIVVGQMEGEELRVQRGSTLRKLYLQDDRIIGFCLAGDLSAAGIYRALMIKRVNVAPFKHRLLNPGFGMGTIEGLAHSPQFAL